MSGPHIEVVRRALDAVGRGDLQALLAEVDPDVVLHPLMSVWERTYRGHAGVEQWRNDSAELWDAFEVEPESFRELEDDALLVLGHWHGRARGAVTELDGPIALVARFRAGKALSLDVYLDEAHALSALEPDR